MERLGIYLFFDPDGVVDDYVPFYLQSLKQHCSKLVTVVNKPVTDTGLLKLQQACDEVLVRENTGFDSWAYKYAIETLDYDAIQQYDELLLCNYTCFGPIYSFSELFDEMDKRGCDFWGVHFHPENHKHRVANHKIPKHVQSHFIVFRQNILRHDKFKEYWDTLKPVTNYDEAIAHHELRCTPYFQDLGFKADSYLDAEKYFHYLPAGNASVLAAYKQLQEDRSPLLKRRIFFLHDGCIAYPLQDGHKNYEVIEFIEKNTSYDTDMIYYNLLRTQGHNLADSEKKNYRYYKYLLFSYLFPWKIHRYRLRMARHNKIMTHKKFKELFYH